MPIDYKQGKIYKLVSDNSDDIYIGSTCQSLTARLGGHKRDYNSYLKEDKNRRYCTAQKILEKENCKIVLIEKYPCNDKIELFKKEREWIENLNCVNKQKPYTSDIEKKEYMIEYHKNHYENNKEEINEKTLKRYHLNKDKINKKTKEYRENNKEKEKIRHKKYNEENKDIINLKRREKYKLKKQQLI